MIYKEIKRAVLGHINQYSMSGSQVAPSYNNQVDYLLRIPALLNSALVRIRTDVNPLVKVQELTRGASYGGMLRHTLPKDFWALKTGGVAKVSDTGIQSTNDYRLQGREYILVPKDGDYVIEYMSYPNQLPADPQDDYDLEEDPEVLAAAELYAAANLVMLEDEAAYSYLTNEFESRLARMMTPPTAETRTIEDVYGFEGGTE